LSELLILDKIFNTINFRLGHKNLAPLRPCDYFDLICGTSTGGLIALLLGRLQMVIRLSSLLIQTIPECLRVYTSLCQKVFKTSNIFGSKYNHHILEDEIRTILKSYGKSTDERLAEPNCCKTFVVAVHVTGGGPSRLRTYSQENGKASGCTIVQAARATSAAPSIFSPITITSPTTGVQSKFIDGGIGHNNPSEQAICESNQIWPGRKIGILLSVGTGTSVPREFSNSIIRFITKISAAQLITRLVTECEETHNRVLGHPQLAQGKTGRYFRFNVDHVGAVNLDEWESLESVNSQTEQYFNRLDVMQANSDCADLLLKLKKQSKKIPKGLHGS